MTPLIGRERDVLSVQQLLMESGLRLVSLTGPAGVGKTRLAIRIATDVSNSGAKNVIFVAAASIADPALVLPSIARALDIPENIDVSPTDQIVSVIGNRPFLLVLDNFEGVVDAGPAIRSLLDACEALRILVTSRVALRLSVEQEYPVAPLELPVHGGNQSLSSLATNSAVALFLQRARAARPDFALTDSNSADVVEVCRRLDGLPLAIELAAARAKMLSPRALIARLSQRLEILSGGPRDLPIRHQTMRNAIAWSDELLDVEGQRLFRRLSIFVGGFTLDAAEAVCGSDLDGIAALADASLLRHETGPDEETRYVMLETVREFGLERLVSSGEALEFQERHARWCLDLVERAEKGFFGPEQVSWLDRLEVERDNLRAALSWATSQDDATLSLRLAAGSWCLWRVRGHRTEGRMWLERALRQDSSIASRERAKALDAAGDLAWVQGDDALAETLHAESLNYSRSVDDPEGTARALFGLADVSLRRRDADRAATLLEEALALNRATGDLLWEAACLVSLGQVARLRNDDLTAGELIGRAINLYRRIGYTWGTAWATTILAHLKHQQGDLTGAASLFRESASLARHHRDNKGIATALDGLALIAANASQPDLAARLFGASQALAESVGAPFDESDVRAAAIGSIRSELEEDRFGIEIEAGRSLSIGDAMSQAEHVPLALQTQWQPGVNRSTKPTVPAIGLLSPREIEVLRLLADGRSAQAIAGDLFISHRTVTTHISNILGKLGVDSRAAAVAVALRTGLV